jgi:hypothetical protein
LSCQGRLSDRAEPVRKRFLFSFRGDTGPEHNDHGVSPTLKNCTGKARAAGFFLKTTISGIACAVKVKQNAPRSFEGTGRFVCFGRFWEKERIKEWKNMQGDTISSSLRRR